MSNVLWLIFRIVFSIILRMMDVVDFIKDWSKQKVNPTFTRLFLVYFLGFLALALGWWVGFLGPVLSSAGWVVKVIGSLVLAHMILSFYIAHKSKSLHAFMFDAMDYEPQMAFKVLDLRKKHKNAENLVSWLDKIDTSILTVGFLSKLYGIATTLMAVSTTGDPAAVAASLGSISHGVSVALFSTMMGLGLSMWTHCATLVIANKINSASE